MDIGNAKMAVFLAVEVFDDFFVEAYERGLIEAVSSGDRDTPLGVRHVTTRLDAPRLSVHIDPDGELYTRLRVAGQVEIRPQGEPGVDTLPLPFDFHVRMTFFLKPRDDDLPVLALRYDGVDGDTGTPLISAQEVDQLFDSPGIRGLLEQVELDVAGPMAAGLQEIYAELGRQYDRKQFRIERHILRGSNSEGKLDAIGVFLNLPRLSAAPGSSRSHLPANMGMGVVYHRTLLDQMLAHQARSQIGEDIDGARVERLALKMGDAHLQVSGRLDKDGAKVTFRGPVHLTMPRHYARLSVNTRDVAVDVDLPWYAEALSYLALVCTLLPGLGILNIWIVPAIWSIDDDVANAPGRVRGGLASPLARGLSELAEGLKLGQGVGGIEPYSTPDHAAIENGHLALFAQVLVRHVESTIAHGWFSSSQRRFTLYELENGRRFRPSELARLVRDGRISTPGHHQVDGRYMRANPDARDDNNLSQRFTPTP